MHKDRLISGSLILALVVLVGVGLWKTSGRKAAELIAVKRRCRAVMGTDCTLAAVVPPGRRAHAEGALQEAEAVLRRAEARMSSWLDDSEIGQLNAADGGVHVPLSPETLEVLRLARQANLQTDGTFDVTCRPLVELWRAAGQRGALPSRAELAEARAASSWELIELTHSGAIKRSHTARVDLGGIAKGWAIDRAATVLRRAGLSGGMVDVGGDLVCFGRPPEGDRWPVDVKNPLHAEHLESIRRPVARTEGGWGRGAPTRSIGRRAPRNSPHWGLAPLDPSHPDLRSSDRFLDRLRLAAGAVCTSGGYARFTQIAGRRYSHIIDPRTGQPAAAALSVTVIADDAATADIWATALSVLGTDGLEQLPGGVEAMMMVGTKADHQTVCTAGFGKLLDECGSRK